MTGTLASIGQTGSYAVLNVTTDVGAEVRVCADDDTAIVHVLADDETVTLFDILDFEVLEIGSVIEAFGDTDSLPVGCDIVANQVIVEAP